MELRAAAAIRKPIVMVHESDDRYGGAELSAIIESAPEDIQVLFDSLDVIPHRRKPEERRIMLNDIYHAARAQARSDTTMHRPVSLRGDRLISRSARASLSSSERGPCYSDEDLTRFASSRSFAVDGGS